MKAIGKFSLSNKHKKNKKSTDSAKKNKDKKEKKEKKAKKKSTDKKKEKAEKKKKKEKKQQDSDSSSDSNSDPRTEEPTAKTEAKEGVVKSNEKLEKKLGPLPGACLKFPNHSSFALKILMEERPDLLADGGTIDSAEAEMLDKYVKEKSEFQEEDAFHSNDNFDEDERCFISYSVFLKYNEGRYSALYIVTKQLCTNNDLHDEPGCFMLKTGLRKNSITNNARMQREMRVMKELLPVARKNVVLPTLVECGKACDMNYIVMTMLDNNLEKLKEDLGGKFKLPSAIYIAQETFNCITELHAHKYIHRDVKPMNFCIGMNQNRFRIYIIDFGESVRPGTVLKLGSPDAATLPFCSLDAHRNDAAREKMDMESWFYMICDIIQPGCISWKGSFDEEEVLAEKKKFWTELKTRVGDSRLQSIGELVILKNEYNKNDQNKIRSLLQEAREAALNGAKLQLDWIAPPPVVAVRKVKTAK